MKLQISDIPLPNAIKKRLFRDKQALTIYDSWDVLMGQRRVVNWPRSGPGRPRVMSYPGEYVLPGGALETGETLANCARRELLEETLLEGCVSPEVVNLFKFNIFRTKVVRKRQHVMHNFVALASENRWLRDLSLENANRRIRASVELEKRAVDTGVYWEMRLAEREKVGSELVDLQWFPIKDAILMTMSSVSPDLKTVNLFQKKLFQKHGITRRDPMMATCFTLMSVAACAGESELKSHGAAHGNKMWGRRAAKSGVPVRKRSKNVALASGPRSAL